MSLNAIPSEFSDLEPYLSWGLPTERERYVHRLGSSYSAIEEFYSTALPRVDEVLGWLDKHPIEEVESHPLMLLLLGLAEVAPAVEFYKQPDVINALDASRLEIFQ